MQESSGEVLYGSRIAELNEEITDSAFDLGKAHLATVAVDGSISIFERSNGQDDWERLYQWTCTGQHHLTRVCWAHPVNGLLLATGSSDGRVSVWCQATSLQSGRHESGADLPEPSMQLKSEVSVSGRVVDMEFAPKEKGLGLAIASANEVSIFRPSPRGDNSWQLETRVDQSSSGALNCACWRLSGDKLPPLLLVGSRTEAQVWIYRQELMSWQACKVVHSGNISSASWASSINRPQELLALSSNKTVWIKGLSNAADNPKVEDISRLEHPAVVKKVGWHPVASWLAVSLENSEVHLWRSNLVGHWKLMHRLVGTAVDSMET